MKPIFLKLGLVGMIALAAASLELFLPIDRFTFRVWEAVTVRGIPKSAYLPAGGFYPSYHFERREIGDIAPYTAFQVVKDVIWDVDANGFRNSPSSCTDWPVVVAGDSFGVGTGLTQADMFASQLATASRQCVYNMTGIPLWEAGVAMHQYGMKPKVVVWVTNERTFDKFRPLEGPFLHSETPAVEAEWWTPFWVLVDRMSRPTLPQFKNRHGMFRTVARALGRDSAFIDGGDPQMIFYFRKSQTAEWTDLEPMAASVASYQKVLRKEGIRFLVVPVPDKEAVYSDLIPKQDLPPFLPRFYKQLSEKGVEFVDVYHPYRKAYQDSRKFLYHTDDTHWNAAGVRIAIEKTIQALAH